VVKAYFHIRNKKMKLLTILTFALTVLASHKMAITKEMTEYLKQNVKWEVTEYEDNIFKDWTEEEMDVFIGKNDRNLEEIPELKYEDSPSEPVPENFDARIQWPKCVYPIRDQGHCGSCYAHGSTEALSDRFCINGVDANLAPQDLISCSKKEYGCDGGLMVNSYYHLEHEGAVTEECFPYVSGQGKVPPCPTSCPSGKPYKKYKCKPGSVASIKEKSHKMREEIYKNGPVTTMQRYCDDFAYYKSGIYYYHAGRCSGWHIMKVLGWGVENEMAYNNLGN